MTRKEKRVAGRSKRQAVVSRLSWGALTPGDKSIICAALIHERDRMWDEAGRFSFDNGVIEDAQKVATFKDKWRRLNAVLARLGHPAAPVIKVAKGG